MKSITKEEFASNFLAALSEAHFKLRDDIKDFFLTLKENLSSENERKIVNIFIENFMIAEDEKRALCQDTGYLQLFVEIGRDVKLEFDIQSTADEITADFYTKNYLRSSLIHPLTKQNTGNNTPVFVDYLITEGDKLRVDILVKGGGSENATRTRLLLPALQQKKIEDIIVEEIKALGSKACPPYILGICIGGNLEKALYQSKRLLLYKTYENPMSEEEISLAESLKDKLNRLPIGFQGLKFGPTVIDLKLKILPSHIATLPLAISVGCNSVRQASFVI
ncbi:MAG: fumarate hydratase [Brevinematia bacterium]